MEIPTLKKYMVKKYFSLASSDSMGNNKLIVVTPAGTFCGYPYAIEKTESADNLSSDEIMLQATLMIAEKYRTEYEIPTDATLPENDGCICLKDASLITGARTINLPFITIFYDQIVAVTLGNLE